MYKIAVAKNRIVSQNEPLVYFVYIVDCSLVILHFNKMYFFISQLTFSGIASIKGGKTIK